MLKKWYDSEGKDCKMRMLSAQPMGGECLKKSHLLVGLVRWSHYYILIVIFLAVQAKRKQ